MCRLDGDGPTARLARRLLGEAARADAEAISSTDNYRQCSMIALLHKYQASQAHKNTTKSRQPSLYYL